MKILILANHYNTLRIFRRELIKRLASDGHEVIISIPKCDDENKDILASYGARVIFTEFERRGTNPIKDFALYKEYKKLIKSEHPDKVIAYTIKCNIYGALACKKFSVDHYSNVTGLGSTFQSKNLMRSLVSFLYKISLKHSKRVFFENTGNRDVLVGEKIVRKEDTFVLPGAGVNLDEFSPSEYPAKDEPLRFLYIGRIMREKGIDEYFDAIKRIKAEHPTIQFDFIGWYEDNYESIVSKMTDDGLLNFYGFQSDVKPFITRASCVVLPSWHEGMSNTLLESAAMCRPLIASNIHGCKESIIDNETGYLSNVRDADSLYEKITAFIQLPYDTKKAMGIKGRSYMEQKFDKNLVVDITLKEIFEP